MVASGETCWIPRRGADDKVGFAQGGKTSSFSSPTALNPLERRVAGRNDEGVRADLEEQSLFRLDGRFDDGGGRHRDLLEIYRLGVTLRSWPHRALSAQTIALFNKRSHSEVLARHSSLAASRVKRVVLVGRG
jgi:hypothetical protein